MLNVPLLGADSAAGELNVRLSAATLNRDGLQDNIFASAPQSELGTRDRDVYMGQLQWRAWRLVLCLYTYDRTRIDEIPESPWLTNVNPADRRYRQEPGALRRIDEDDRPDTIQLNGAGIADTEVDGHALDIRWDLTDSMTLQSLTGYREMFNFSAADSDGSPLHGSSTRDVQSNEALSQEVSSVWHRLDRVDYSAGLFYMDEEGDVYQEQIAFGGSSGAIADYKNEAWAVYGQGTLALTDRLDLTVGARYTEEEREMGKASYAGRSFSPPATLDEIKADPALAASFFPPASKDFDNVSWLVSLGYNWTDDVMTYAKVSTGFQSGGFNARDGNPVGLRQRLQGRNPSGVRARAEIALGGPFPGERRGVLQRLRRQTGQPVQPANPGQRAAQCRCRRNLGCRNRVARTTDGQPAGGTQLWSRRPRVRGIS